MLVLAESNIVFNLQLVKTSQVGDVILFRMIFIIKYQNIQKVESFVIQFSEFALF